MEMYTNHVVSSSERKFEGLPVIAALYEMTDGIQGEQFVFSTDLAHKLGIDGSSLLDLASYLQGKKLAKVGILVGLETQ